LENLEGRDRENRTTLKSLTFREQTKTDFAYLQSIYKGTRGKGISHILIPTIDGLWKITTGPVTIERYLIKRNIEHFGQANDTPFANGEFLKIFGYTGKNENSESLIREQYILEALESESEYTNAIIQQLGNGKFLTTYQPMHHLKNSAWG
jgi:hypothetical protein